MARKKTERFLTIYITPEDAKLIDDYYLAVVKKYGVTSAFGIRSKLARVAIREWLKKHGNDVDILFKLDEQQERNKK